MKFSFSAILPLILFLAVIGGFAVALTRDPSHLPSALLDRPLPEFELENLYVETEILTQDIIAGQAAIINVFGSWCVACVTEHPFLAEIEKQALVTLVGMNWRDKREAGVKWLAQYGDPYDYVLFDPDSVLAIDMGVTGAPETYLVDPLGRVRYKHRGILTPQIWNQEFMPLIMEFQTP